MEAAYNANRGGALRAAFWGNGDAETVEMESVSDSEESRRRDLGLATPDSFMQRIKSGLRKLFMLTYPWLHAANEGMNEWPIIIIHPSVTESDIFIVWT